ncbi:hypothetical protein PoB_002938900 [Plakobranchus ocellatus]|uniref:Uncharacterized protein n=1 Tax=Plakobranchus ocellatus TaxID=259542 RepID=A0AAV4A5C2_9GAST|nr:hypothetical protein PoB_002938900 [Plakobranchus ocellatus]
MNKTGDRCGPLYTQLGSRPFFLGQERTRAREAFHRPPPDSSRPGLGKPFIAVLLTPLDQGSEALHRRPPDSSRPGLGKPFIALLLTPLDQGLGKPFIAVVLIPLGQGSGTFFG